MSRRIMVLIVCNLLVFSMLIAGCGTTKGASETASTSSVKQDETAPEMKDWKGTIKISEIEYPDQDTIDPATGETKKGLNRVKDIIEKTYPNVKVEVKVLTYKGLNEKMNALIASNDLDIVNAPVRVQTPDQMEELSSYFAKDPEFDPSNWKNVWDPEFVSTLQFRDPTRKEFLGKYYALPNTRNKFIVLCDKKIFDDYGLQIPGPDYTMNDLLDLAKKMTGTDPKTGKQTYGAHCGDLWFAGDTLALFSSGVAGEPLITIPDNDIQRIDMAEVQKTIKDNPDMLEFFKFWSEFVKTMPKGYAAGEGIQNFGNANNDVAICVTPGLSTQVMNYISQDPSMNERYVAINYPKNKFGKAGRTEYGGISMTKSCADKELGWEILKFMSKSIEIDNVICDKSFPALLDITGFELNEKYSFMADVFKILGNGIPEDDWMNGERFFFVAMNDCMEKVGNGQLKPEDAPSNAFDVIVKEIENAKTQSVK